MTRGLATREGQRLARAMLAALAAVNAAGFVVEWQTRGAEVVCVLWWSVTRRDGGVAATRPEALAMTCEALADATAHQGGDARAARLRVLATELRAALAAAVPPTIPPPAEGTRAA